MFRLPTPEGETHSLDEMKQYRHGKYVVSLLDNFSSFHYTILSLYPKLPTQRSSSSFKHEMIENSFLGSPFTAHAAAREASMMYDVSPSDQVNHTFVGQLIRTFHVPLAA
jgi:hypothetical protein